MTFGHARYQIYCIIIFFFITCQNLTCLPEHLQHHCSRPTSNRHLRVYILVGSFFLLIPRSAARTRFTFLVKTGKKIVYIMQTQIVIVMLRVMVRGIITRLHSVLPPIVLIKILYYRARCEPRIRHDRRTEHRRYVRVWCVLSTPRAYELRRFQR